VNPATVLDVNHWQPLQYFDATGTFVTPKYIAPFWGKVTPFALTSGDQFRSVIAQSAPALFGSAVFVKQAQDLITISAYLTDEQKMIAVGGWPAFGAATRPLGPLCTTCLGKG